MRVIVAPPRCGGNHLLNLVAASQALEGYRTMAELLPLYSQPGERAHHNTRWLSARQWQWPLTLAHAHQVAHCLHEGMAPGLITHVLVIRVPGMFDGGAQLDWDRAWSYTTRVVGALLPGSQCTELAAEAVAGDHAALSRALCPTPFAISAESRHLHDLWRSRAGPAPWLRWS